MAEIDLSYESLQELIAPHQGQARTESRAFLAWYLENIHRLESYAAQDAVCDGIDDKGVDGIYVDHDGSRIDIFQARTVQSDKSIGDTQIKEFAGTLAQFETPESVERIAEETQNVELAGLLHDESVADRVRDDYEVRGILVTNATIDPSATAYLENSGKNIIIQGRSQIEDAFIPAVHSPPVRNPLTFDVFGFDVAEYRVGDVPVVVAPLAATELVKMEGIESGALFDYNVRQSLGRTKVNKDIEQSIRTPSEHQNFLLYHNGITVVCETADSTPDGKLTIENYVVVNGCQTLTALWDRRADVSPDLRILARIIVLPHSSPLMEKITHHSNNQNGIKPRDFQSNSAIQLRLRNEFEREYGATVFYQISRGEESGLPELIDNDLAARILLAFDVQEPWSSHQTYKLFDELYARIFARPAVSAHRILALHDIYTVIEAQLTDIKNDLLAKYTLTKFFLVYLVRRALDTDDLGKAFIQDPAPFLNEDNGRERLRTCIREILRDLIIDLNGEVQERDESGTPFDFKRDLKSADAVRNLTRATLGAYQRLVQRGRSPSFSELWSSAGEAT